MFSFFKLDLPYQPNVYFDIISAEVVYQPPGKLSPFTRVCFNQRFS